MTLSPRVLKASALYYKNKKILQLAHQDQLMTNGYIKSLWLTILGRLRDGQIESIINYMRIIL